MHHPKVAEDRSTDIIISDVFLITERSTPCFRCHDNDDVFSSSSPSCVFLTPVLKESRLFPVDRLTLR